MIEQSLVDYIKQARAKGVSDDIIRQVLMEQGWQEQQVNDTFSFVELREIPVPKVPSTSYPTQTHQINPSPNQQVVQPKQAKPREPDPSSPYSKMLVGVLLFSLLILTHTIIEDVNDSLEPARLDAPEAPINPPTAQLPICPLPAATVSQRGITSYDCLTTNEAGFPIRWQAGPMPRATDSSTCGIIDKINQDYYSCLATQKDIQTKNASKITEYQKEQAEYLGKYQTWQKTYDEQRSKVAGSRLVVEAFLVIPFWALTFLLSWSIRSRGERFKILLVPYYITSGWLLVRLLFDVSRYILDASATFGVYLVLVMLAVVLTLAVIFIQRYTHKHKLNP